MARNREKASDLFEQELSMAFRTISSAPYAGKRYPHPDVEVYRVLMRSTRNHVYYVDLDDQAQGGTVEQMEQGWIGSGTAMRA